MSDIILKDGGTGQELLARSSMPPHPLWSCKVMMEEPEIVQSVHADYIRAGARVITLNTYSVTPERLSREGEPDMFAPLQRRALNLANAAREEVGIDGVKLAACLPPLHGSYRPDMSKSHADLLPFYQEVANAQADGCDLVVAETLSSVSEVTAAAQAGVETSLPTWVFMTLNDDDSGTLRSGEPLSEALSALDDIAVAGLGINCCKPEVLEANLPTVLATGRPTGAYANGFTGIDALEIGGTVDGLKARKDLTPAAHADLAMPWVAQGLHFIGGCCEVGPAHIAELAQRLTTAGHTIVGE
ncbi:homocysteine S-methyltransferase family protein [Shimia sp.]|jgi:S-methylmethionine-dependent homocysteine/selenocysteine methylase|uniref:homocysteine S-methyltransferase family protein n=1 Tax=unclassified Shimia TaxID=2630038 RepID=UPI0025D05EB6|nr:homocysteine S-methyltransferase family protein [Shimia sp.]MCH2067350.1 homocysteine S-methyltransferase family protein [Shimia sp.]